jgi:hypothetical protein
MLLWVLFSLTALTDFRGSDYVGKFERRSMQWLKLKPRNFVTLLLAIVPLVGWPAAHAHRGDGMRRLASAIEASSQTASFCKGSALADVGVAGPLLTTSLHHLSAQPAHPASDWTLSATRGLPCSSLAQLTPPRSQEPSTNLEGGWRLLRTPDPRGGRDSIAVSRTAELLRSDPEFAGMMLRCTGGQIELLFVLVRPLSPRSHPQVTLNFEGKSLRFEATVVPPGASIRLPPEAAALASGAWHSVRELSVAVDDGAAKLNGVVDLQGLRSAYAALRAACDAS